MTEIEKTRCRMCRKMGTMATEYSYLHPKARVCSTCADIVANVFHKYHSGAWLTWPNEPLNQRPERTVPQNLKWEVFERDNFTCKHCGARRHLEPDHIIPMCKGGETNLENLQTLCRKCNGKKGTK